MTVMEWLLLVWGDIPFLAISCDHFMLTIFTAGSHSASSNSLKPTYRLILAHLDPSSATDPITNSGSGSVVCSDLGCNRTNDFMQIRGQVDMHDSHLE